MRPGAADDDLWIGDVGLVELGGGQPSERPLRRGPAELRLAVLRGETGRGTAPNYAYRQNAAAACNETTLPYTAVTPPHFAYFHTQREGECFPSGELDSYVPPATIASGSSITGVTFYTGGAYPDEYDGGLFFGDYARGCMWFMEATNGVPDRTRVREFARWDVSDPYAPDIGLVGLERGPEGDVYIADLAGERIRRLEYGPGAALAASVARGASPLPVTFDASASTVPAGESVIGYDWDFDGDGVVDEQTTTPTANHVYPDKGVQRARVTVHYADGDDDTSDEVPILVDPPQNVEVTTPGDPSAVRWSVGDAIPIAGSAEAGGSGAPLAPSQLEWSLVIRHCEEDGNCHSHQADSQLSGLGTGNTGTAGTLAGPDHAYPSHLELRLTARDPLDPQLATTTTVSLDPATVKVLVTSDPPGRTLSANLRSGAGPSLCEVIRGSLTTVAATISESAGVTLRVRRVVGRR